jgi:hypothetical protein
MHGCKLLRHSKPHYHQFSSEFVISLYFTKSIVHHTDKLESLKESNDNSETILHKINFTNPDGPIQ